MLVAMVTAIVFFLLRSFALHFFLLFLCGAHSIILASLGGKSFVIFIVCVIYIDSFANISSNRNKNEIVKEFIRFV